tara:strand:+ start:4436 stop:4897 length:462 start_codon:yes stop_codon:yes gene_type:complete
MKEIHFYGHESKGIIAGLIRWKIGSAINHISIGANNYVFESTALSNGVTVSSRKRDDIIMKQSLVVTDDEYEKIINYLDDSVGKEYDFSAFVSFALNKKRQNDAKVFCNEFAAGILDIISVDYKISRNLASPKDFMYFIKGLKQGLLRAQNDK